MPINNECLHLFKSLFKSREDVFAIRWEKGTKSGYIPAYYFDPYRFRAHKIKGRTFQNYTDKSYLKLSDEQLLKHFNGEQQIGIYPLLPDNTSCFIAADFDEENWIDECRKFLKICTENNLPAYLERSRSGNGGHIWIFFEQSYPAAKSRKIILALLQAINSISQFDKNSSFDRLFPNQDFLSGKGLGNLIALPFNGHAMEKGNSCFIDSDTLEAFSDQWKFIAAIKKVPVTHLDNLFAKFSESICSSNKIQLSNDKLEITLNNHVSINRNAIPLALTNFLKEELNFANSTFFVKKNSGRNTFGTDRYFRFIEEKENAVIIPKGFIGKLLRYCKENSIEYTFKDHREKLPIVNYSFNAKLREHQGVAVDASCKKDIGIIVAPPGSGKTVVALNIIAQKQQPALIIVHRKQLLEQWINRIENFLGIPKHEIGKISQGKLKPGKKITIATIQSLSKQVEKTDIANTVTSSFGTIIVDECHHIPAETYRTAISKFNSYYLYGLTATPFRKYNDGKLIFIHLGEIIAEIKPQETSNTVSPKIIIRNTALNVPFNSKTDKFEALSKILIHDSTRNSLILNDVAKELDAGKKVVIITERKEHIDALHLYLKQSYEIITLSGDDNESSRSAKWKILQQGNYQVIITTGQFFGEGTDLQNANCLFLVYPFSFEGKLIQYIGRVQRSEIAPVIYDYRDIKINYLNKLFLKRNTYYRKIERQITLFDEPVETASQQNNIISIHCKEKIAIEDLEFRYGNVAFTYFVKEASQSLEFEIVNDEIRPEFEVMKPYFVKLLHSKTISVLIQAEFENGQLVSQLAESADLASINREIIEGVKFRFIASNFFGKSKVAPTKNNDKHILKEDVPVYDSVENFLEDILKKGQFKHQRQLRYLAMQHAAELLKLRYVLSPFSFVFLLHGNEQWHIVLETLDSEEATYLWHFQKNEVDITTILKKVDSDLAIIRDKGRQIFLLSPPENFSRIMHDYSNEQKGFIVWKDLLNEQLV